MVHGGSRSTHLGGRRWPAIVLAAVVSLTMTAGEPMRDIAAQPNPRHRQIRLAKTTSLPSTSQPSPVSLNSISMVPISGEMLYDAWPTFVKPSPLSAESLATPVQARVMTVYVTAYCACKKCCGSHAKGITASGRPTTYNGGHFVAADTSILPYGSKVIVPGYNDGKPVEVIDRGGAIKGAHIDIFMPTHEQAVEWGKKQMEITIVQ